MSHVFFHKSTAAKNWGFRQRSPQTLEMVYLPEADCWVWPGPPHRAV